MQSKAYRDLVDLNKLPNDEYLEDKYSLLNERCRRERKNAIYAVSNVPNLLIDNLDQPDPDADKRIQRVFEKINDEVNLAFLTGPSGSGRLISL